MEVKTEQLGEVTVVHVSGKLNLEKNMSFREACLRSLSNQKIVFSLRHLQFVGSSGIQSFFRTLSEIHQKTSCEVKIAEVNPDFLRLLQYAALPDLEIMPSVETALSRFASLESSN